MQSWRDAKRYLTCPLNPQLCITCYFALDRIVHHGRLVEFGGPSHRMDAALMLAGAKEKI